MGKGKLIDTQVAWKVRLLRTIVGTMWEARKAVLSYADEVIQSLFRLDKSPKKISEDATMAAMKKRRRHFGY